MHFWLSFKFYTPSYYFLKKPHSHPNGFNWGHQCSWTLTPAKNMQVSVIQYDDHNRKVPGLSQGLNLPCLRILGWMGEQIRCQHIVQPALQLLNQFTPQLSQFSYIWTLMQKSILIYYIWTVKWVKMLCTWTTATAVVTKIIINVMHMARLQTKS